jgi:hypothetical protein
MRFTKRIVAEAKIRSVSDGKRRGWGPGETRRCWAPREMLTKRIVAEAKIRSVSDGCERGWGPARN